MKPRSDDISSMNPSHRGRGNGQSVGRLARTAVICGAALFALPAMATLVSPIQVSLFAPGGTTSDASPLSLSQTVSAATPITTGDGGAIGNFMLPAEQIALAGDSIKIRAAQGDPAGGTGYLGSGLEHARYEFSALSIAGRTLTGFNMFASDGYLDAGFSGLLSGVGVSLVDTNADTFLDTLIFNLDDLLFVDRGHGESENFAEFRIDILSTPTITPPPPPPPTGVPEPGTLVLAAAALGALRFSSRRTGGKVSKSRNSHV